MSAQAGFFRIRFTADPVELTFFRAGLDRWLVGLEWPDLDRQDAVLAVNEACDDSVRHAYLGDARGEVEVVARLTVGSDDRRIVAVVRDHGLSPLRWGADDLGLTVVRACMDRVKISRTASGTTMTMTSRPVPLLDTVSGGEPLKVDPPVPLWAETRF
jgi:anti-sigma regulatory factor (Ser/Thr protein kinase)